jgi:isoleucyl-tRNA synthetase
MEAVRGYVNEGLGLRAKAGLKVRQPLASVTVPKSGKSVKFEDILIEELNVKEVKIGEKVSIDEKLTPSLKREGLMREVIRHVQACRKKADLQVDDRIILWLETADKELQKAIDEHINTIKHETLAEEIKDTQENRQTVKIEDKDLTISLKKM